MRAQAPLVFADGLCNGAHVDWNDLRFVLALSRRGSLSQAAADLLTTHTIVSRRIRALEDTLGSRLFDATPDGYVPTPAGLRLVATAQRCEAELLTLEAAIVGGDARLEGPLRVSTMDILFRRYHAVFLSFCRRYPGIALTLVCSDDEAVLNRRDADVALRMTNTPPEHLVGKKVDVVDFAVYAAKATADVVPRPVVHWDERKDARWLDAWLKQNAPDSPIGIRVDVSSAVLRDVVAAGFGAHHLAVFEGDADQRLVRVSDVDPRHRRHVWLLTLKELQTTTRVRAFLDHVAGALAS